MIKYKRISDDKIFDVIREEIGTITLTSDDIAEEAYVLKRETVNRLYLPIYIKDDIEEE